MELRQFGLIGICYLLGFTGTACQQNGTQEQEAFFKEIRNKKIQSDPSVEWRNFGPGMSGYCEGFWCHPTDPKVMFSGPDMHVSYGSWDAGKSWQSLKDPDGLGQEMKRVLDIEFSRQNPDYGMAIDWNGWAYETQDRGRSWKKIRELGRSYKDAGVDPDGPDSFKKGWYFEQEGARHSELAVDPTNDNIWYVGAGDFWNVKSNHKSAAKPHGIILKYADYGYIWKTSDKGKTWTKLSKGLPEDTDVARIIINPRHNDSLIMACNHGLMISGDGGNSWLSSSSGLPNNLPRDLTSWHNPRTGEFELYLVEQTIYEEKGTTVTAKGGVYKSMDGGKNWTNITGNLYFDLNAISFPAERERYFRTLAHWFGITNSESKKKFTSLPGETLPVFNRIAINPMNKDEIYVSYNKKHDFTFGPGDAWKTEDGGKNWTACARQGAYWNEGKDEMYWKGRGNPVGANVEFAHLQRYMDAGTARQGNRMMAINSLGEVFIGIDQQTLKTSDRGLSWKQVDDFETSPGSERWIGRGGSNLPGRFMLLETGIPGRSLLCSGEHGLWQTTGLDGWKDEGAIAVEQIEGQCHEHGAVSISTVAVHPENPDMIYLLSWRQDHRGKLRRTCDGGKSWENIASIFDSDNSPWSGVAPQNSLCIDPDNPDNMYFCSTFLRISEIGIGPGPSLSKGGYGFYRSSDGGYTWELSNKGFHKGASVRRVVQHPDHPEVLYAALNDDQGGLFRTENRGAEWSRVEIPSEIRAVNNVFIDRHNKYIYISTGRRDGSYEEGGVWQSKDKGLSWKQIFKAPYVWQAESSPVNTELIVISVAGQGVDMEDAFMNPGVYLSKDGGGSWLKINKGLGQPDKIVDVKPDPVDEDVLWCASWGCGWFKAVIN